MHRHHRPDPPAGDPVVAPIGGQLRNVLQIVGQFPGIEAQRTKLTVYKVRDCSAIRHCIGRCYKCKCRGQNFVPALHPREFQCNLKSGRPIHNSYRALCPSKFGQVSLEAIDIGADRRHPTCIDAVFDIRPLIPLKQWLWRECGTCSSRSTRRNAATTSATSKAESECISICFVGIEIPWITEPPDRFRQTATEAVEFAVAWLPS